MRCFDCREKLKEFTGDLTLNNTTIGEFTVENVCHHKCVNCGKLLFSPETLKIIEVKEEEIKEYRLSQYPIADFIGATEAAAMLNISRQALHRNRRIRRGFIYHMHFGGKIAYLKKSVELFKDKGDGRFILADPDITTQLKYITITKPSLINPALVIPKADDFRDQPHWQKETEVIDEAEFILSEDMAIKLNHFQP